MVLKLGQNPSAADIRFDEQATRTYTYNSDGTIASMTISSTNPISSSTFNYAYNSSGQISSITTSGDFARTKTFTYNTDGTINSVIIT